MARGEVAGSEAVEVESVARAERARAEPAGTGQVAAPVVARLENVSVVGARGERAVDGVSLEVRRGEVVGVAGVEGNGQHELAQVLAGRRAPDAGTAAIPSDPSFIPQDRRREGHAVGDEEQEVGRPCARPGEKGLPHRVEVSRRGALERALAHADQCLSDKSAVGLSSSSRARAARGSRSTARWRVRARR